MWIEEGRQEGLQEAQTQAVAQMSDPHGGIGLGVLPASDLPMPEYYYQPVSHETFSISTPATVPNPHCRIGLVTMKDGRVFYISRVKP